MTTKQLSILNSESLIGLQLEYGYKKDMITVIDEDKTHVLIQFKSGAKIATPKTGFTTELN